ncbi:MAG: hypothetical protein AAGF12_40725, partial [Myxococcota bacterium]
LLVIGGLASVVAFFLPFIDLGGMIQASGWDILTKDGVEWNIRLAMLALPLGGLALVFSGLSASRRSRLVGFVFGASVYGYLAFLVIRAFLATTGVGLWVTLAAAALCIVAAVFGKKK